MPFTRDVIDEHVCEYFNEALDFVKVKYVNQNDIDRADRSLRKGLEYLGRAGSNVVLGQNKVEIHQLSCFPAYERTNAIIASYYSSQKMKKFAVKIGIASGVAVLVVAILAAVTRR